MLIGYIQHIIRSNNIFTEFRINPNRILLGLISLTVVVSVAMIATELLLDLPSADILFLPIFAVFNAGLIIAFVTDMNRKTIAIAYITAYYLVLQIEMTRNPTIFYDQTYWLATVPLVTVLVLGLGAGILSMIFIIASIVINGLQSIQKVGDTFTISLSNSSYIGSGILFNIVVFIVVYFVYNLLGNAYYSSKSNQLELEQVKNILEHKNYRLESYQLALLNFNRDHSAHMGSTLHFYQKICEVAAQKLQINRVSLWFYKDDKTKLVCEVLLDNGHFEAKNGVELHQHDFPKYFEASINEPYIMATHAHSHQHTSEFSESYLTPLDILSMLDCPIVADQNTIGVMCCENRFNVRDWSTEDALFVQSLADCIALFYKNQEVQALLQEIKNQNSQLVAKSNEVAMANEELKAAFEELDVINANLEATVQKRTQELSEQNKQLSEYAFINAHILRAPLTRILGISDLIQHELKAESQKTLVKSLISSCEELDVISHKMSALLDSNTTLSKAELEMLLSGWTNKVSKG